PDPLLKSVEIRLKNNVTWILFFVIIKNNGIPIYKI
ncbi:MAG: hypothetical protein ACI8P3_004537, partial [Saprospiraceae bacterium]